MKIKTNKIIQVLSICCLAYNVLTYADDSKTTISEEELQRFTKAVTIIKENYIKSTSDAKLVDDAIQGMLTELDPHSAYIKGNKVKILDMLLEHGKFEGIGIDLEPDGALLKVTAVIDNSPAKKAGIRVGDSILRINDKVTKNMPPKEMFSLLNGSKGNKVTLTVIQKNHHKPRTITLTREIIKIQAVKWDLLTPNYGYIRISLFTQQGFDDVSKAILKLQKAAKGNLHGVILDLRNNAGGLFESAIRVTNCFMGAEDLKENRIIAYTKSRDNETGTVAKANYGAFLPKTPLVVLINEGTASAAEIVAGALQDHKRAIIAGTHSFGKGTVQTPFVLDKKSLIKITTALYYTPYGHSIQVKGIIPDVIINDFKIQENKQAAEESAGVENLAAHVEQGTDKTPQKNRQRQEQENNEIALAHKDYQLYEALHLLEGLSAVDNAQHITTLSVKR